MANNGMKNLYGVIAIAKDKFYRKYFSMKSKKLLVTLLVASSILTACNNGSSATSGSSPLSATVSLPQTGQTPTLPITATAGMDGFTYLGVPWAYVPSGATTPATRFTAGTGVEANCVTDNLTGLMWVKDLNTVTINGAASGSATPWQNALDSIATVNTVGYCGHNDWYLPTVNDLSSLVNYGFSNGANNHQSEWLISQGFANVQTALYWSSSSKAAESTTFALGIFMLGGAEMVLDKSSLSEYVWPVRRGNLAVAPAQVPATGESGGAIGSNQGVAWPSQRFGAGSGATVDCITDKLTGLMWPKNGLIGFNSGTSTDLLAQPNYANNVPVNNIESWSDALTAVNNMNTAPSKLCGYSDWRLPNVVELKSLVNYGQISTANWLAAQGFENVQAHSYLSSTTSATVEGYVWLVSMRGDDHVGPGNKNFATYYVWPVRGGQ